MAIEKMIGNIEAVVAGRMRMVQQPHPCFIRRTSAFAPVAGNAGADHIVPGVLSTSTPWNNMVQGELPGLTATILTGVLVTVKYLRSAQLSLMSRTGNHIDKPDYRRYLKYAIGGVELTSIVFQHFGLAPKQ